LTVATQRPIVEKPRKRTLRLVGKQPTVTTPARASINGTATLPPAPSATVNGTGVMH